MGKMMPKTYYKKVRTPKPRNPVFANMVQRKTMSINDKREKVARRRHQHEMFQAKHLRKDLKDV